MGNQWRSQEKISGFKVMPPPERQRIFEDVQKNLKENCKNAVFSPILQKISKARVKFSWVWRKNTIGWGNVEKILKISDESSIEKLNF